MSPFIRQATIACMALAGLSLACDPLPGGGSLPVYSFDQTDSAHAGYRRTTITSGGAVFVHDFEEDSLQLADPDPKQVVGRSKFGSGKICAIEGQSPDAYLAADMGSEMPAYEVFRAERQPPFDWRHATFSSEHLPGLVFTPAVYFDPAGQVYLAENLTAIEFHGSNQSIRAKWNPASALFTQWAKTAD